MTTSIDAKLVKGDAVTIIAPASHLRKENDHFVEAGKEILTRWGLEVVDLNLRSKPHFYLAGTDQRRAMELNTALSDSDIKAIFSIRGGYGCARLMPMIDFRPNNNLKILCGFSDLTVLILALHKVIPNLTTIHGPHIATQQFTRPDAEGDLTRSRLKELLFKPESVLVDGIEVINSGNASGPIIGGCLSLIVSLIGTPYEPDFKGKILFIEDVDESPYKIDRMITHLKLAGIFDQVNGVVLGDMQGCTAPNLELMDIIGELFEQYSFPVVSGFKAGHGAVNLAFRIGNMAEINGDLCQLTLN